MRQLLLVLLPLLIACQSELTTFHVVRGDVALPVVVRGPADADTLLVFQHGGPGQASLDEVYAFEQTLQKRFLYASWAQRTSAYASGKVTRDNSTFAEHAADLGAVLRVLRQRYPGKKVVAVGYSFGGILTLQHLGGEAPEPVDGVVLIAAPAVDEVVEREDFALLDAFAETQISAGNDVDAWSEFRTLAEGQAAAHAELPPRQYFDDYVKPRLSRCDAMEHALQLSSLPKPAEQAGEIDPSAALVVPGKFVGARILDWLVPELVRFDLRAEASRIQLPALLLWGEDDCQVALSAGQQLLQDLGSVQKRLVSRAHAGHQLPYQEPDFVAREIEQFVDAL